MVDSFSATSVFYQPTWDEEDMLEIFVSDSEEAVVSFLNLHWVNDLPGQSNRYFGKIRHIF